MATQLIMETHKTYNSPELTTPIRNEYAIDEGQRFRNPKVLPQNVIVQPDITPDYGKTVRYFLNPHSGILSMNDITLNLTLSISTVSAGVGSYVDGYMLNLIKKITFRTATREIFKEDRHSIYSLYQRFKTQRRNQFLAEARKGATGADVAINTTQSAALFIYTPFHDFRTLKTGLIRERPYFEVEFAPLSEILVSTLPATLAGSITTANINVNYLVFGQSAKNEILRNPNDMSSYFDYMNVNLAAGATAALVDLTGFGESEVLTLYISDTTTNTPFTGLTNITDIRLLIDNKYYPEEAIPIRAQLIQQSQFFGHSLDSGVYTLRFSAVSSYDDEIEENHIPYGSVALRQIQSPKLQLTFTALANDSVLHIMNYARAWYKYQDGELVVEAKN